MERVRSQEGRDLNKKKQFCGIPSHELKKIKLHVHEPRMKDKK